MSDETRLTSSADPAARPGRTPSPQQPAAKRTTAHWSLQAQLRRQLLALIGGIWLLASAGAGLGLWQELNNVLDSALTETGQRLLLLPDAALAGQFGIEPMADMGPHKEYVVYQLFDQQELMRLRSHQAPVTALDAGAPDGVRRAGDWHVLTLRRADGQRLVQVAESVDHRHAVVWAGLLWLLGMLMALMALAALGVGWMLRRGFAAMEPARLELAQRAQHNLAPVALDGAPAELKPWLDTVNSLLGRVRALVDGERAFAANTAHELRTPLAAAMAQAQRLVHQTSTDANSRELALALLRQLDRLTHLATRLLQLARIESGVALQREPVDLVQLAVLVADDFAEAQRSGRLQLLVHGQPQPVSGDIDALGIALRNLIDNALKHGGDATTVRLHIEGQSLRVEDDGPGVAPEHVAGLVRKFDRGGGTVQAGSGLGLAMVNTIALQSGARLLLQSPRPEGPGFSASLLFDIEKPARRA